MPAIIPKKPWFYVVFFASNETVPSRRVAHATPDQRCIKQRESRRIFPTRAPRLQRKLAPLLRGARVDSNRTPPEMCAKQESKSSLCTVPFLINNDESNVKRQNGDESVPLPRFPRRLAARASLHAEKNGQYTYHVLQATFRGNA